PLSIGQDARNRKSDWPRHSEQMRWESSDACGAYPFVRPYPPGHWSHRSPLIRYIAPWPLRAWKTILYCGLPAPRVRFWANRVEITEDVPYLLAHSCRASV